MGTQVTPFSVRQAVTQVRQALDDGANTVVLSGQTGAGKSSALRELASSPLGAFKDVVLIAPPKGEQSLDSGLVALVELAAQLDDNKLLQKVKRNDVRWKGKLEDVTHQLISRAPRTLVLFDEPLLDTSPGPLSSVFADRAADLSRTLLNIKGLRKVVATSSTLPEAHVVEVARRSAPSEILSPDNWDPVLASAAAQLLAAGGDLLTDQSPLELRLRVGLVATGTSPIKAAGPRHALHKLIGQLLEQVGAESTDLKQVLGRLALLRVPFDLEALDDMGAGELSSRCQSLLRQTFLFGPPEGLLLHESIAQEATRWQWLTSHGRIQAHRKAARYHDARYRHSNEKFKVRAAVRHELEVIHHLTHAGDATKLLERSLFFVEQYDALGKVLSQQGRHDEAVHAYKRALAHDSDDAYAHHYLGYNLDILAQSPQQVEAHFKSAIRANPSHVWYHGRHINFLVTRGRVREARSAWEAALDALLPSGSSLNEPLYRELHGALSRLLLHRGQLEFARDVLNDVPLQLRPGLPWYRALRRLHDALWVAASGDEVFPPHISPEEQWKGPHLLHRAADSARVEHWAPGRIAEASSTEVHLRMALPPPPREEPSFVWRDLSIEEYQALALDTKDREELPSAGTFVEVIKFHGETEFLRCHPVIPFEDVDLPYLFPPPDRYLRRGPPGA
ncbi:tetratricopeptide repeat protein [Myxococcus faecalis]|uniref:tetratricopeptide repeat protein n=1 Tax=Myxococcus faecalis TaxID=3115646 RepID=UPI0038D172F7